MLFEGHIGVVHGAGADGAFDPFARQFIFEQVDGIGFDQHVLIKAVDAITLTTRITVNAAMLAAPVQVHVVFETKPGIRLLDRI
ncbi:MAG: hypothetical protein GWP17_02075 [Aquificales bacterium]|nr:hypothetical protein [Aquificales bacterium]